MSTFVLIVGGGKTGSHLAELLLEGGFQVRVVELRNSVLAKLHKELPTEVIVRGDATDNHTLIDAGIEQADVLAAVTGDDQVNLVVTSLARFQFGVKRVIARVNNPKNSWLFTPDFGVDVAPDQADMMTRLIAEEMSMGDMMTLLKLRRGEVSLVEEKISVGAPADGKAVRDLKLPPNCTLAALIRKDEVLTIQGGTVLHAGDEILAVVRSDQKAALEAVLTYKPAQH
ncbi:MAG: potassium transporter TrkA [Anaerolineae bacterium CG2_30_64_16]|nr:MAG: potassium transporter TrkA [Anaerolineae bacterium CG2_30_64_16]